MESQLQLARNYFLVFFSVPYLSSQQSRILSSVDFAAGDENHGTLRRATPLCDKDPTLCAKGAQIKGHIRSRRQFSSPLKTGEARILIRDDVFGFFGSSRWLTAVALDECPQSCSITKNAEEFEVSVSLFNLPRYLFVFALTISPDKAYAV
jgi:hypothetical protein